MQFTVKCDVLSLDFACNEKNFKIGSLLKMLDFYFYFFIYNGVIAVPSLIEALITFSPLLISSLFLDLFVLLINCVLVAHFLLSSSTSQQRALTPRPCSRTPLCKSSIAESWISRGLFNTRRKDIPSSSSGSMRAHS